MSEPELFGTWSASGVAPADTVTVDGERDPVIDGRNLNNDPVTPIMEVVWCLPLGPVGQADLRTALAEAGYHLAPNVPLPDRAPSRADDPETSHSAVPVTSDLQTA